MTHASFCCVTGVARQFNDKEQPIIFLSHHRIQNNDQNDFSGLIAINQVIETHQHNLQITTQSEV